MAKYTGQNLVIRFGTAVVSGQGRSLDIDLSADEIDATSYGDAEKSFLAGKPDRKASMEVLDDSASSAIRTALAVGTINSMTWFPQGTASGNPKFAAATAVVLSNSISYPYDDVVTMSVDVRISGGVVESTASGTGT